MFYEDMNVDGFCIEPNFNINHKIEDVLNESLEKIKNSKESIQYVYYTEPDTMMHIHGTNTRQTRRVCKGIDKKIKKYVFCYFIAIFSIFSCIFFTLSFRYFSPL